MPEPDANTHFHITFVRHGQSVGNLEGRVQGRSEFPLTETGRKQSQALGQRWLAEGRRFDHVISSPQSRSRETAEIIAGCLDLAVEFDELWMERDYGNLSGMLGEEAEKVEQRPLYGMPYQPVGQVGESLLDLHLRAGQALNSLMRRAPGQYLVVSHGGILNMVLYNILGIVPQAYFRGPRFAFRNAAFTSLTYHSTEHIWRMVGLNDRAHWTAED
jgi:broad specificity phosphatase PhoE